MRIFLLVFIIILTGCGTAAIQSVALQGTPGEATAIIRSECPAVCQTDIGERFSIVEMASLVGRDEPVKDYIVLVSVNGERGTGTHFDPGGAFNGSWNGGFTIQTTVGIVELEVIPSSRANAPGEQLSLSFLAAEGHEYMVGSMGWREIQGAVQINNWYPVIYDLTDGVIVYPRDDPSWRKYCTRNQEFAGSVSCP